MNIFISHTPHHLTLNISIILQERLRDNTLILFEDFNINNELLEWLNIYFNDIILIESSYKIHRKYKNKLANIFFLRKMFLSQVKKIKGIINELDKEKINKIYCSNDQYIEVQVLLEYLKSTNTKIAYIEDGSAAYHSEICTKDNFRFIDYFRLDEFCIFRVFFKKSRKYQNISCLGGSDYIQYGYYLYPHLVRPELIDKECIQIEHKNYKKVEENRIAIRENINDSVVICLDISNYIDVSKMEEMIKMLLSIDKKIYIKYHPREFNLFANKYASSNVEILPNDVSIESLLINSKGNIVIGSGISTLFLTLPILSDNKYVLVSNIIGIKLNDRYKNTLKSIGIIEAINENEIIEICKQKK